MSITENESQRACLREVRACVRASFCQKGPNVVQHCVLTECIAAQHAHLASKRIIVGIWQMCHTQHDFQKPSWPSRYTIQEFQHDRFRWKESMEGLPNCYALPLSHTTCTSWASHCAAIQMQSHKPRVKLSKTPCMTIQQHFEKPRCAVYGIVLLSLSLGKSAPQSVCFAVTSPVCTTNTCQWGIKRSLM